MLGKSYEEDIIRKSVVQQIVDNSHEYNNRTNDQIYIYVLSQNTLQMPTRQIKYNEI